jgi:acyl carrier protein
MKHLESELKTLLIEVLNLEDIEEADIDSTAPLFGDGLGLDSIDALELGVAVRQKYGVDFDAEPENIRDHFASIENLAKFIAAAPKT